MVGGHGIASRQAGSLLFVWCGAPAQQQLHTLASSCWARFRLTSALHQGAGRGKHSGKRHACTGMPAAQGGADRPCGSSNARAALAHHHWYCWPHLRSARCGARSWSRCSLRLQSLQRCMGKCACQSRTCKEAGPGTEGVSSGHYYQHPCATSWMLTHQVHASLRSSQPPATCSPIIPAHNVARQQLAVLLRSIDRLGLAIGAGSSGLGPRWAGGCGGYWPSRQVLQAANVQVSCGRDAHSKRACASHAARAGRKAGLGVEHGRAGLTSCAGCFGHASGWQLRTNFACCGAFSIHKQVGEQRCNSSERLTPRRRRPVVRWPAAW